MHETADRAEPRRVAVPLAAKLAVLFGGFAVVVAVLLVVWVGPHASHSFRARSTPLIAEGAAGMRSVRDDAIDQSRQVLTRLIDYSTDARSRLLVDMPLELYAGDIDALRGAIRERDADRGDRLRDNVDVLIREMARRFASRIEGRLAAIDAEQRQLADGFAAEIRESYLWLFGGVFVVLLASLGFGLSRFVARPVRRLSDCTRAVARGDLDVAVRSGSRDEVGALAADFATMIAELRGARAELRAKNEQLARWNETLEDEVSRKTEHLERALADLKGAQRQLVHAAKMASVGTLAGGVAHEFGNLIAGIRGSAVEALEDAADDHAREPLEVIVRAADRASDITRNLLRFARQNVDAGRVVDIAGIVREAVALLEPQARRLAATVTVGGGLAPGAPDSRVEGDPSALHQVIVNLITNALQAIEDGGHVMVTVDSEDDEVRVVVEDDGCGIESAALESVFDPFYTTKDHETDPFRRGHGLGLAVSYGIVEAHGGRIVATSTAGEGARFEIRLPARRAPEDQEEE